MNLINTAKELLKEINSRGYEAYMVGGVVRDLVMGNSPKDVDIATNMPIPELEKYYECHDIGKSKDFGIVVINFWGFSFEVAQYRTDGKYSNGRHPDSVIFVSSIEEDLARRDLTINAMAMDHNENLIDPYSGCKDIEEKIIRFVGDPVERIEEDYLRILRAIRFAKIFNFDLDFATALAISALSHKLPKYIAKERISDELIKMACHSGNSFANVVDIMKYLGVLQNILPEVDVMYQFDHNPKFHPEGNVWEHTLAALRSYKGNDYRVNLALLFHDVGKTGTQTIEESGDIRYHGHESESVRIAEEILRKYKFSNDDIDTILFCIGNHMKACKIEEMRPGKIYKIASHKDWSLLQDVLYCDKVSRGDRFNRNRFNEMMEHYTDVANRWKSKLNEKSNHIVSGHYVMHLTGLKPGPEIGRILKEITEWAIEGNMNDPKDIDRMIKWLSDGGTIY